MKGVKSILITIAVHAPTVYFDVKSLYELQKYEA